MFALKSAFDDFLLFLVCSFLYLFVVAVAIIQRPQLLLTLLYISVSDHLCLFYFVF